MVLARESELQELQIHLHQLTHAVIADKVALRLFEMALGGVCERQPKSDAFLFVIDLSLQSNSPPGV
jgi:hypothetical protein